MCIIFFLVLFVLTKTPWPSENSNSLFYYLLKKWDSCDSNSNYYFLFLINEQTAENITEIVLGKIAGKGGFNTVFKISKINLQECFDTDANQAKLRATLANEMSEDDLVLKKISNDLPKEAYEKAAVDLAIEVRFLKKFSYAHIISLRWTYTVTFL